MWCRNRLFDWGILKVQKVPRKVISVGNLSMGGTGKSPHVEWIAEQLSSDQKVAILSRGYGRSTKGFVSVTSSAKSTTVGDEALFYKTRFGSSVHVAVCEKRVDGANRLIELHPEIKTIVLDDAYQHRYIHRDLNVLLTTYEDPFYRDHVVPVGRLREFRAGKQRADVVIVTKCPTDLSAANKAQIIRRINVRPEVEVFFSSIRYGRLLSFEGKEIDDVPERIVLVTGIANAEPLKTYLEKIAKVEHVNFGDHHDFTGADIKRIHNLFGTFAEQNTCIVTTSKDFVRIKNSTVGNLVKNYPWFYQEITVEIQDSERLVEKLK